MTSTSGTSASTSWPPKAGKMATLPVLAQMSSLGIFLRCFMFVQSPKSYDVSEPTVTTSALADDLDAFPNVAIYRSNRPGLSHYVEEGKKG